ncbi:MAG: hypothetical protein P4L79_13345, partial [Legionella sp.]|uniref:hypothetical protein n=1 Tax=Legionella sp. TaxID=459 RepID=UPI00284A7699|nr:hypothetical protein [Legionella sp.]
DNNYSPIPEGFYDKTPLTQIRDAAGKIWEDYGDEILRYGPKALGVWGSRSPALETDTSLTTSDYLKMAGSFALDCIPIVGQLKAAEQVWSGKEMLTEARMHRGLAALGLLPGGKLAYTAFKALGKTGSKLGVLGSKTSVVEEIVQTVPNRVSDLESIAARRVYLNEKFGRTGDLNYDIAFRGYMEKVDTLNVASKPGEAVFYSGWNPSGISNRELGEAFARSKGWTTLEQTTGGKWLDQEKLYGSSKQGDFLKPVDADKVWARLSQNYAMGVEKSVTAFVNGANSNRVFYQYEYPILMNRGIKIKFMN